MPNTPKDLHSAMVALKRGEISPEQFRSIMRASRASKSIAQHDADKFRAATALNVRA